MNPDIVVPFPTPSVPLRGGTWKGIFFFRVPFLMASDDCGLNELSSDFCSNSISSFPLLFHFQHLLRRWELKRAEVFFFSSAFHMSWPLMIVHWMDCNMHLFYECNVELSIVVSFPTTFEALGFRTWRSFFFFPRSIFHGFRRLWIGWTIMCTSVLSYPLYFHFQHLSRRWELESIWRSIFSPVFHFSWPRVLLVWLSYNVRFSVFSESGWDTYLLDTWWWLTASRRRPRWCAVHQSPTHLSIYPFCLTPQVVTCGGR